MVCPFLLDLQKRMKTREKYLTPSKKETNPLRC